MTAKKRERVRRERRAILIRRDVELNFIVCVYCVRGRDFGFGYIQNGEREGGERESAVQCSGR